MPGQLGLNRSGCSPGRPKFVHLWNPQIRSPMASCVDSRGRACSLEPQILSPFLAPNLFTYWLHSYRQVSPTVGRLWVTRPKTVHHYPPQILSPFGDGNRPPNPFTKAPNPQPLGPNSVHQSPKSTGGAPQWCSPKPQIYAPNNLQSVVGLRFPVAKGCLKG